MTYTDKNGKKSVYNPHYSTEDALEYFENIIGDIKKNIAQDEYSDLEYNLLPTIYEDLYWRHCFNYIKYKTFFDKYGFQIKVAIKKNKDWEMDGFTRATEIFCGDSLFGKIKIFLKYFNFMLWIYKSFFSGKKNKVWVHPNLIDNHRFNISHLFNDAKILKLSEFVLSIRSTKRSSKELNRAIINTIIAKNKSFYLWKFAIKLLKPTKIILMDNLFNSYSILLAAKSLNVNIVGISHGLVSYWHRGIIGSRHFANDETQLRYDMYYAWHNTMVKMIQKESFLYDINQIEESGWLRKVPNIKTVQKNISTNNIILYPFEWLSNYKLITKVISQFSEHKYKIIIKTHPDIDDYSYLTKYNVELVDDFQTNHYKKADFILGSTTTMIFEMGFTGKPVVILKDDGFDMFNGIQDNSWVQINNVNSFVSSFLQTSLNTDTSITKKFINSIY
jgi:hypothetical protein